MEELKQFFIKHLPLASFDDDEIEILAEIAEKIDLPLRQVLFEEADPGDSIYLVVTGAIDLYTCLKENIEHILMTVRPGGFVGAMALIDGDVRDVNAKAAEATVLYRFNCLALNTLSAEQQNLGVKLLRLTAGVLCDRLRITVASLRQNLEWTMQVSGLASLDISQLIIDRVNIIIELVNGKQLEGTIVKAEERPSGFELFLATSDDNIHLIPYHAIVSASLPGDAIKSNLDKSSSY